MDARKKWTAIGAASALGLGLTGFGAITVANADTTDSIPAQVPGLSTVTDTNLAQIGSTATSTSIDVATDTVSVVSPATAVSAPTAPSAPSAVSTPSPVSPQTPDSPASPVSAPSVPSVD